MTKLSRIITESERELSIIAAEAKAYKMSYGHYTVWLRGGNPPPPIQREQQKQYCIHCGTDITTVRSRGHKSPFCAACGGNGSIQKLYKGAKNNEQKRS